MTTGTAQLYQEKGDTWPKVLRYNYKEYGDTHRAMRHKHYGVWQPYTWKDYYLRVKTLALGLVSLGLEPGDRVLIVGDNAPEWYYAELAAQAVQAVAVGAYSELTPVEIQYVARNSDAAFAVVQDQEQVDKLLQVMDALPGLKRVVYWNYKGLSHYKDSVLMGFREVLERGKKYEEEHPGVFERRVETGKEDDVCAIVYTSGTTGEVPKGAVHTYRTLRAGAEYHLRLDPWHDHDNMVPHLPPVWINEQWLAIGCHLLSASTLNFAEGPETLQRDTREIGPSIVCRGARLWESQAAMIRARISSAGPLNRFAFRTLMPVGHKTGGSGLGPGQPGLFRRVISSLVDRTFLAPIRRSLGLQNARVCYTTGAILSPEAFRFYHDLHLPLKSLYGSTEGGALTGAKNDDIRLDTVGPAHEGSEVRVTGDGEIIYRQLGTFVGYYKDPDKTAEMLKDGWFHSGDHAIIRDDGHVVFVDRVKDVVPLQSGENLVPQLLESRLRFSPYIKDAWVLAGPEGKYVSAVIVINYETVGSWAGERRVSYSTFTELAQRPEVYELVKEDIERVNSTLSPRCRVRKYVHLHREFDPDEGELTRNRKLRRAFLEDRYRDLIKALYGHGTEARIEVRAGHGDGGAGTVKTSIRIQTVEGVGA